MASAISLATDRGHVEAVPAEAEAMPDIRPQPTDLRHQMARIGHEPRPGAIDLDRLQLRIDIHHALAQHIREAARLAGAGGDTSAPEQAPAAIDEAVLIARTAIIEYAGRRLQAGAETLGRPPR